MVIRGLELVTNCTVLGKTKQKNETVGVENKDGYGVSKWKPRIRHTISILQLSVDAVEMIMPAQELGTPVAQGLGLANSLDRRPT